MTRDQKIALAEMRVSGVRDVLIYCADCAGLICRKPVKWPFK